MNIPFLSIDLRELEPIEEIRELNFRVLRYFSAFLTQCPRIITGELIESLIGGGGISREEAYIALMGELCGLDAEAKSSDKRICRDYFPKGIRCLSAEKYLENPYYKNISIPETARGRWEFRREGYEPYEGFACGDILLLEDFREIPQIGFFDRSFSFPAVLENGREWMMITPNEIETMESAVGEVRGKVAALGLGLGYFAYMASEKDEVESVTVVERDGDVIGMFEQYILPQFQNGKKIRIVRDDAFKYAKNSMQGENFDYAFVDIWNDPSNGVELYLKMRKLETLNKGTKFLYWIEKTLLSYVRWAVFRRLLESARASGGKGGRPISLQELRRLLSDEGLKELVMG